MARIDAVEIGTFDAPEGQRLVLAIEDAGIDILHRCGGHARCTTCRVEVLAGDFTPPTARERRRLAREEDLPGNIRLSCQCLVRGDARIRVVNRLAGSGLADPGPRPSDDLPADG
jgi:ferredoxin